MSSQSSVGPVRLERATVNPLLEPIPGSDWEGRTVFNAGVADVDGATVLIYRGQGPGNDVSRLGFAVSTDGVHFARLDRPVIVPGAPTEVRGVEDPRLTFLDGRWYMVYTAWSAGNIEVAMASTTNFFTWERHGTVIPGPDNKDAALFPGKVGGRYAMFHRIPPSMWLAFSDDLTGGVWGDYAEIMRPRPGNWDGWKLGAGGPPLRTDHGWLVIYHGVAQPKRYCLGVALLDLEDPRRVVNWPAAAILEPEEPWERHGDVDNVVFTCGTSERDGRYYVYYGGADRVIGVATVGRDELIAFARHGEPRHPR